MIYLVYTIHITVSLFLILVVLLQQGKGADLSVFGGGSTQTAFGARGAATLLHKLTVGSFIAFIFTTMAIGFLQSGGSQSSVMTGVEDQQPVEPGTDTPAPTAVEETLPEQPVEPSGQTGDLPVDEDDTADDVEPPPEGD